MPQDDLLLYECNNLNFSPSKEGTIILNNPNKTLLCSQYIKIEWESTSILKFYALLSCIIESNKIQVEYTVYIEKNNCENFEVDFITNNNHCYNTFAIDIISRDKHGNYMTFTKNDNVIIKIYGSSIDAQNRIVTSPKLLNPVFCIYTK